jgi:pimeloyl-ACP methyl ester carboxylesterase
VASRRVRMPDGVVLHTEVEGSDRDPVLILLHGFPELGYSWRHQVRPLADAGYRVIAPDLRGYGRSDVPEDVTAYAIDVLGRDVTSLLDDAGAERGVVIGHDWGADVAWKTAWLHPDRIAAVAGLSVPFVPRAPGPPLEIMRRHMGDGFYILWFQRPGVAEEALARDVRRTLATPRVWDAAWADDPEEDPPTPAFMTDEELAVYVDAFQRTGFAGGLSYYRNIDRNWELTAQLDGRRIDQPALFLTGERDPVRGFMPVEAMDGWVTDLRASIVVPEAGHWVNQQAPQAVNDALLGWLSELRD